jgi:polysaccharide deacetylase family protein (PEP-CTERM system associated)
MPVILSFDVEEHDRIEAASGLAISPALKAHYRERLTPSTHWILEQLAERDAKATFFVLGQIAEHSPQLIREIHNAGHEIANHGWDHRRVCTMKPDQFRHDLRQSKVALEQVTGDEVLGYRAPTFSIGKQNPWAIDILVEEGFAYDSSIFPVRHDRYGVPAAPRSPFVVDGEQLSMLELPPMTLRILGVTMPMGGGGYFRLFPLWCTEWAIHQSLNNCDPPVAMMYFHPWEFDRLQQQLPLSRINRFRTYVGNGRNQSRLNELSNRRRSCRAIDVVRKLASQKNSLPRFGLAEKPQLAAAL